MKNMKPLVTVSDEAKEWLSSYVERENGNVAGIRVTINSKGCAGGEYEFKPVHDADNISDCDTITDNGITLFVPRLQMLNLIGSELVLFKDRLNMRLDFKNPNEAERCGCGESVSFKPARP